MRKMIIILTVLISILVLCSCTKQKAAKPTEATPTQPVPTTPSEPVEKERPDVWECATAEGYVTKESLDSGTLCQVYLTKERDKKNQTYKYSYDLYITVYIGDQVIKEKLESGVSTLPVDSMYLGDVDGDGSQEIVIHNNTGGVGGFGLWRVWVLKLEDDEFDILFKNFDEFDTGFESRFLDGYQMEVTNCITDYKLVFDVKEGHRKYIEEADKLPSDEIWLDPFYEFVPDDVDNDGISEIVCKQYTSIYGHADYTGSACCVLKFNTDAQNFEVVDAWYEPYVEE